ncbi:beta-propeller fold lactonase family protein [Pseudomonas costantinii]|uniref:beta-propeller fold lactonase family protein n=1 Tax=Pseudomonas costantinii TaxID=168469 RepID=UPI0015A337D0|nr:beta-propeller fold lactonase family protein [Pseudomonas costantinii]NVZ71122.1 beta-propeller fold lactonase family protein [Pseudomonas costantinii]
MSTLPPPYDDLPSDPYSAYPTTDLTKTLYPEVSPEGLGRRGLWPYATFMIERWDRWSLGDYYGFRLGDLTKPIASGNVQSDEPRYPVNIDGTLIPEGNNQYFARVVRVGSLQESRSATKTILCKQTIPAGHDQGIWEPWHSGLFMWLRDLQEGAILNPSTIAGGLWVVIQPYLNIRQNDIITIYVDGKPFEYVVSPTDASANKPIEILIPEAILQQITPSGPVGIVFTVRDVVGNIPEGKYWLSKPLQLISEMKPGLLDNPVFTVDGNESGQVDLDTLGKSICAVLVTLPRKTPAPNPRNQVVVVLGITLADGTTRTVRLPAVPDRNLRGETVPVDNALLKELAGGWLRIWFEWLSAAGALLGTSSSYLVTVFGTPTLMPPLTLTPYQAGLVPPNTDVQATIPTYMPHDPKNLETVICERVEPGGGGQLVKYLQLAGPQGGTRLLSMASLKVFEGKGTFQAYYETNDGKGTPASIRESETLDVEIGVRVADLPPMLLPDAEGSNIDPGKVKGTDTLMFIPFGGTRTGDKVDWSAIGMDAQSSAQGSIDINGAIAGPALASVGISLSVDILKKNYGGILHISYSVVSPGTPPSILRSQVLDLTVGPPVVLQLLKILEADATAGTIAPTAVLNGATLKVDYSPKLAGDVVAYEWNGQYDVSNVKGEISVDPTAQTITVPIPPEVIAKGLRPDGNNISVDCRVTRGPSVYPFATLKLRLLPFAQLPTPRISGFENTTVLQVGQLTPASRITVAVWDFRVLGQPKWCTVSGTLSDGSDFSRDILIADPLTAGELKNGVSFAAPVDDLKNLMEGSTCYIKFRVSFPSIPSLQTATLFGVAAYIVQTVPTTLPAPAFANKPGASLSIYPLDYVAGGFVAVIYPMTTTQTVSLKWMYPDGTLATIATQKGVSGGRLDFPISLQILAASVGKVITLRYDVTTGTKTVSSNTQVLTVQSLKPGDLPQPLINGLANGAILDLLSFNTNGVLTLSKWPLSVTGQFVWITATANGVELLDVLTAYPITAAEAASGLANVQVSRPWLDRIPANTQILITVYIGFDGNAEKSKAVVLPQTTYTVKPRIGVIDTLTVGTQPHYVCISSDAAWAYVSNRDSDSVSVIDIKARKVIQTISAIPKAFVMVLSPDDSRLYVGNIDSQTVTVIDTATRTVLLKFPVASAYQLYGLALNGNGSRLFVASYGGGFVAVLDTKTGAVLRTIGVLGPKTLTLNPEKTEVFITTSSSQVSVVNADGLSGIIRTSPGLNPLEWTMAFNPGNLPYPRLYLACTNTVQIIDTSRNVVINTLTGFRYPWGVAMNPRAPECYVGSVGPGGTLANRDSLFVINTVTEQVVRRHPGFGNIAIIAFTRDGSLALVVDNARGTVSFFAT